MISKSNSAFKKYHTSTILLFILALILVVIACYRVLIQIEIGPIWDTFDFLSNAMYFVGQGFGYTDLTRPPVLPFLTSIFFRFGIISEIPIFILDGLFYIFGALGLYFLFKMKFNPIESFLGSLLFATFPIVLFFTGLGLSDIPSVCFSIWAVYFTVLAVREDSKMFYISFLLTMLAFLTRYPAGLIIFPIFTYLIINRKIINYRDAILGILISFLPLILILIFFYYTFNNPFYPFGSFYASTQGSVSPILNYYYFPDFFYFIKNIPTYVGSAGITIIAFVLLGSLMLIFRRREEIKIPKYFNNKNIINKINLSLLILLVIFLLSLNQIPWIFSEVIFLLLVITISLILNNEKFKHLDMDLLMLIWFMVFFIFHSIYVIKDDRYFLTMAPALSYFLILCFNKVSKSFNLKGNLKFTRHLLIIILVVVMLISAFTYLPGITKHENLEKKVAEDSKISSQWLIQHDPEFKSKVIYADLGPYFSWYLKMNVKTMPVFMNGQSYGYQIKGYNMTDMDLQAYNNELVNNNAVYYFSIRSGLNLTNYQLLIRFGTISLYGRK